MNLVVGLVPLKMAWPTCMNSLTLFRIGVFVGGRVTVAYEVLIALVQSTLTTVRGFIVSGTIGGATRMYVATGGATSDTTRVVDTLAARVIGASAIGSLVPSRPQ